MSLCILDRVLSFFTPKVINNRVLAKPGKSLLAFRNIILEFPSNPEFVLYMNNHRSGRKIDISIAVVSSFVKNASFSEHDGAAYSESQSIVVIHSPKSLQLLPLKSLNLILRVGSVIFLGKLEFTRMT